jgi:fibronectin type 3 domain-containing protein
MRKPAAIIATVALVIGMAALVPVASATALTPGIAFSAANLPTWQVNSEVYGLASVHGKVVVGGNFTQLSPPVGGSGTAMAITGLAILNAETGSPDSCQLPITFSAGTAVVRSVVASPDGNTIYIGGDFTSVGGVSVTRIAAINPVTCAVLPLRVSAVAGQVIGLDATSTTLYMGGLFTTVGGQVRNHFAAVSLATGALLPWAPSIGTIAGQSVAVGRAIAVSPDGSKVAIGGDFFTVNGQDSHSIAVVDSNTGANLMNYPRGFIPDTSVTKTIWSDGTDFYVGNEGTGGGVFDGRLMIDWATLTQQWRDNCLGATQALITYQGTLYIASHAHNCDSNSAFGDGTRNFFMAEGAANHNILQWFPTANDGINEGIGPRALTIGTGATTGQNFLWYGGEFTQVNGKAQQGLTRFGPNDTTTPPVPVASAEALTSNSVQVRFRTVVDPDDGILTYNVYRNGGTTPVYTGQASSTWWSRPQVTFVDNNVTAGTTYSYRVTANDGTNTSALSTAVTAKAVTKANDYPSQVIADGANLYWRMDEAAAPSGTWAQDKSGPTLAGLNGIYKFGVTAGTPGAIAGSSDTAATFDGSTGYIYSDQLRPGPTTYSIETWVNTTSTSGGKIVGYGNGLPETNSGATNLSGNYDRQIYMDNAGHLTFGVYTGGAQTITTGNTYNNGAWHYIVATQGPSGMVLYVDGKKVGVNPTTTAQSYNGSWRVGGDNLNGWPNQPSSNFFAGSIDDTAIYPAPLTPQQVVNHYVLAGGQVVVPPTPADAYGARVFNDNPDLYWRLDESSGTAVTDSSFAAQSAGTYGSGVQLQQSPAIGVGHGASLNGTTDGLISENAPTSSTSAFSEEAWFKTTTTSGGKILGFEDANQGNGSNYDKQIYMSNNGNIVFGVYSNGVQDIETSGAYNDGNWHHVVGTQDGTGMDLYVDGGLVGTNATTTNQSFTGYWRAGGGNIGSWPDQPSSFYFNGNLDEVAVYPAALSASTVSAHYALGSGTTPVDTTPPTVPTGLTATVTGSTAALSWTASTDNVGVTGYSVYRNAAPSFTPSPATKIADVSSTSYSDTSLAVGIYYYEVVATDAAGNLSDSSSSASATIAPPPDTTPPTTPAGVTATVSGTSVALAWTASTDNVGVTGYSVYRGTSAAFAPSAANLIATTAGNTYNDASSLAPGTYYYEVVASDAAGNASGASSAASATIPPAGDTTPPTAPTNVVATVTGTSVGLTWAASTDNVGVTGYNIYRGSVAGFTPSAATKAGSTTGATSFTDSGVAAGTYYYEVVAMDAASNASAPSAAVSATVAPTSVNPVVLTVNPTEDTYVAQSAPTTNYGANTQLSSSGSSTAGSSSYLRFSIPAAPTGTTLTGATISVRTSTDPTAGSVDVHTFSILNGTWSANTVTWNTRPTSIGAALGTLSGATALNTTYTATLDATRLSSLVGSSVSFALTDTGSDNLRLFSEDAAASQRPVLTLTYSQAVGPVDSTPPSVPTGVAAAVSGSTSTVMWAASTDNVGVSGYSVYRGTTAGFVANAASKIADVTGLSFADSGLAVGTYYYEVAARDAAGNVSAASAAASATIAAPPITATLTVNPSEDAYVAALKPTMNYGSDLSLSSTGPGGGSESASYLKFALPAAPAGTHLVGATLTVRTTTDPIAGSVDISTVAIVTGAWTESTVTWATRPTGVGATLGTISGATAINTVYVATLDPSQLAALLGSTAAFSITSTGSDNLRLFSENNTSVSIRPLLTLKYSS